MEKYEINVKLSQFKSKLNDLEKALDIPSLLERIKTNQEISTQKDFWDNNQKASQVLKQTSNLQKKYDTFFELKKKLDDIFDWLEISEENTDEWILLEEDINIFDKLIYAFSIDTLLNGKYDDNNCILEIHPGAGGTEANDWCLMLYDMYIKFCNKHNFKYDIISYLAGDEAGIKSVTLSISGDYAYGRLKSEIGVHRLVRISPFDSNKKRHTSFASVMVIPEIEDDNSIQLLDEDLNIDVYRSGGAGGQSVNTTDSAVRITHIPTGIVVTCQNERSQIKNKETAKKYLIAKLLEKQRIEEEEKLHKLQGTKMTIGWGSQIRSYVFQPYQMIKDHRSNYESFKIDDVFNGNLDEFINEYLKWSYEK